MSGLLHASHRMDQELALGGEELEEYCKKHGLCNLCAQTRTHKRVFSLSKKNQFQPMTVENKDDGEFIVYKGYCVQPGCFSLEQAKRLLGEIGPKKESATIVSPKKSFGSRLLRGRGRSDDNASVKSGRSRNKTAKYNKPVGGGFDGISGMSGFNTTKKKGGGSRGTTASVTSEIRRDDDEMSVASSRSTMTSNTTVRRTLHTLLKDNAGSMLDLSSTRLHHVHITELVNSLRVASSLQSLILENCKLNDNEIEVIGNGMADGMVAPLKRLSFRSNRMGNRGAVSLEAWFLKTSTLESLDLSKNQIGSRGAMSTLHAFRDNPLCKIKMFNFAHNEIWDPDDGTFFATNSTVELLNLEGNFIHDEGIEAIAKGMRANYSRCKLIKLHLGWNGIGDEGCMQLAQMLETNTSLQTLGLGENDITSVGARALVSSLASNSTLREITGLYHNQIDRKFIIAAIKRLLHSHVEQLSGSAKAEQRMSSILESSLSALDTLAEPLGSKLPAPDEVSEGSFDWEDKLYAPGEDGNTPVAGLDPRSPSEEERRRASGVEEAPSRAVQVVPKLQPPGSNGKISHFAKGIDFRELPPPQTDFDRLMVIQSAPLAYFNRATTLHHAVPLSDFDHETLVLKNALKEAEKIGNSIELEVEPGHLHRLKAFFEAGTSRVLHLSCYGHPDYLAFENGAGYIQSVSVDELRKLIKSGKCQLQLVVVNSFHSGRIGKAFIEAGVPHVVCCHHTEVFRDKAASGFTKNLYRALASNKSLKEAFHVAQEAVRVEEISKHVDRYVLLPLKADTDDYHDVPIFFTKSVPPMGIREDDGEAGVETIPRLPKHFIGREVDMYEILEALRVDDVVRVGGAKGSGKTAVVAAVCRYINKRRKMLNYDDVFWLPTAQGVLADEDTLFGDLCTLSDRILQFDQDLSLDEEAMECQERVEIELEGRRTILAIDGRKFKTVAASQNLEKFLGQLLNSALHIKVILITASGEGLAVDTEDDDTIHLGPIDFKSTALLFGEVSRFITPNGCPAAQSPDEFAALMAPPSVAKLQDETLFSSNRRNGLLAGMGNGVPVEVIQAGKKMPASTFINLIGMANTPEVRVDSYKSLQAAVNRWTQQKERAVVLKNYLRASDLEKVLMELEALRPNFPSLTDLMYKEQDLQRKLATAMSSKQYTAGNSIKREILAVKKVIMQEKRSAPALNELTAAERMTDLQAQMQSIMKMAHSSFSDMDNIVAADVNSATFTLGSAYHHCEVSIYAGSVEEFDPGNDLGAAICWTNECCDMGIHKSGGIITEYGGPNLARDISSLPGITKTQWGLAKCGTGNAVIVGPGNYEDLAVHCVILAVGPISPDCDDECQPDDEDGLHYAKIMMRSCIRSSLILAKHSQVQSVAFPTLTTKLGGATYEQTLIMGLTILVEEAKHSDLNNLHIVASTEEESAKLIGMAMDMGLAMAA